MSSILLVVWLRNISRYRISHVGFVNPLASLHRDHDDARNPQAGCLALDHWRGAIRQRMGRATGHVWDANNRPGIFAELKSLGYGDQVEIHAWGQTYTYEVRESKLVTTKNMNAVFQSEEYDWVTLVTCEFYNPFNGEYLFRRAVRAVLCDRRYFRLSTIHIRRFLTKLREKGK
jgi:LPXTG-site transpeptidase (sortase) family protein